MGLIAAYFGGWVDTVIMRIVDLQLSFPAILIALMLLALLGRGVDKIIFALVVVQWAYFARTVRGAALVERRKDYVEAARCLALSHRRIMFRHMLPNCLPPLIVVATVQMAHAIALEATLSFLGVGLPITEPSLGLLIANGFDYMLSGRYWISVFPGIALVLTIVSINLVGDRLRDVLNPRLCDDERRCWNSATCRPISSPATAWPRPSTASSFSLGRGEILGLVGEFGSGKSVTGFSIIGLVDPPGRIARGRSSSTARISSPRGERRCGICAASGSR